MPFRKLNWDALGVTVSVACAIHCAVLPLLLATLPVLGINILHNRGFECGMIGLAFLIGARALWHGFRLHHRRRLPSLLFAVAMLLLIAKQVWPGHERVFVALGVLFILGAHGLNYRLCRVAGVGLSRGGSGGLRRGGDRGGGRVVSSAAAASVRVFPESATGNEADFLPL